MELTSELDQHAGAGDEIDIDLDLTGDNPQDGEDEFMGEEGMNALADSISVDGQESHAANDDEMADDSYAQGHVGEGSSERDEDIEDAEYTGPELGEDTSIGPDTDHLNEQSEELFTTYEEIIGNQNQEQDYQEQEYSEQEHHEVPTTPEAESGTTESVIPDGHTGLVIANHDVVEVATREASDRYDVELSKEATVHGGAAVQTSKPSDSERLNTPEARPELLGEEVLPVSLDKEFVAQLTVEGSHTQEEDPLDSPAHVHPVILDYEGDEMFLFPPIDQSGDHAATFLLPDEQLAYSPIGHLFEACRAVLKGSLSEQDELTINIDDLDIHINESTTKSANTRLSEVIDIYVRLQQNDGLENPPPLYMNLTSENRFSRRLDVLRNASIEGKGLSQLKSSPETESAQQHSVEGDIDPSSHTVVLSSNDNYASEQQPGDETEESLYHYKTQRNMLPSESTTLMTDPAAQRTHSYPITDVSHEDYHRTEPQRGSDNRPPKRRISDTFSSEAAGSKEPLEPVQPTIGGSELQKAEVPIVDEGDFIDYEDVEELETGASSGSSTLRGDAIDVNAVQDRPVQEKPIEPEDQEHLSPHRDQQNFVVAGEFLNDLVDEKATSDVGVSVEEEEEETNLAEILSQDSDDKAHSLSVQNNEEGETPYDYQDAGIPKTKLPPKVHTDNKHLEASAQYEDDAGPYRHDTYKHHDTLHEHQDHTGGESYAVADANSKGGEIEDYSSMHPSKSEYSRSERIFRDNDQGRASDLEAEYELEEADRLLASDDIDHVPQPPEAENTQPSLFVDESAKTREDDDEITYEDEEDDTEFPHQPADAEHNVATSPGPLKRARSFHEDDDTLEEELQGAKRVRSG